MNKDEAERRKLLVRLHTDAVTYCVLQHKAALTRNFSAAGHDLDSVPTTSFVATYLRKQQ